MPAIMGDSSRWVGGEMIDRDRVTECRKGAYRNAAPSPNDTRKVIMDVENANLLLVVDKVLFDDDTKLARETQDDRAVIIHRSALCGNVANDGTKKGRRIS
mmetsp:Transcript_23578/g.38907  ORF Transcript_23578/g.38907 Transcript_23578/m.38907 type:complete len:101 (+) Transcript_23578:2893-3195(+)